MANDNDILLNAEIENRRVYLYGDVDEDSARDMTRLFCRLWDDGPGPITLYVNSPGGSMLDALGIFDTIERSNASKSPVTAVITGHAMSAAIYIVQAAKKRLMTVSSWSLIHEVSTESFGSVARLKNELKFAARLNDQMVAVLAERSTLTEKQIRSRMNGKDWYLTADDCLKFGFVDQIVKRK